MGFFPSSGSLMMQQPVEKSVVLTELGSNGYFLFRQPIYISWLIVKENQMATAIGVNATAEGKRHL